MMAEGNSLAIKDGSIKRIIQASSRSTEIRPASADWIRFALLALLHRRNRIFDAVGRKLLQSAQQIIVLGRTVGRIVEIHEHPLAVLLS